MFSFDNCLRQINDKASLEKLNHIVTMKPRFYLQLEMLTFLLEEEQR